MEINMTQSAKELLCVNDLKANSLTILRRTTLFFLSASLMICPLAAIAADRGMCRALPFASDTMLRDSYRLNHTALKGPAAALPFRYADDDQTGSASDLAVARARVERIVRVSGLEMNFVLIATSTTPASAQVVNGQRIIMFDPRFMARVANAACPDWGAMSVIAHEVGHHLAGHTIRASTSPWKDELEADEFSGFVLARLGASLVDATSAAAAILPEASTRTHPGRADRLKAITYGWQNAHAQETTELRVSRNDHRITPQPQLNFVARPVHAQANRSQFVSRMILYGDKLDYYVDDSARIVGYDGQSHPIGEKAAATTASFAWVFRAQNVEYQVDFSGKVYTRLPSGQLREVGVVTAMTPPVAR